jgi:hypothetical protein
MSDLIHNERTKLTATLLNTVASGLLITGVVAPLVALVYGVPGPAQAAGWLIAVSSFACLAASITIHFVARFVLRALR